MSKKTASARLMGFIEARLSPGGELGLHLSAGLALLLAAVAVFGDLAEDVMGHEQITVRDLLVAQWFHLHAFEPMTTFMLAVSALHNTASMVVLTALLAAYFWHIRARYWLYALLASVPGGMLLNVLLKSVFQRSRPVLEHPLVTLLSYSFPSGHTAAATLFYGVLASYVVITHRSRRVQAAAVSGCLLMVVLVALSRVYLGAHFLSDVLAAMAESVAWLALCITAISTWRRRREGRTL